MLVYSKKTFLLQFAQEQNVLGHSFERRAYCFVLKATQGMVFPIPKHRQSKQWMLNTLLMVDINPICKRYLKG